MNTGNATKIFDAGGLKVTLAVPEKHIINFFWPICIKLHEDMTKCLSRDPSCQMVGRLCLFHKSGDTKMRLMWVQMPHPCFVRPGLCH